MHGSLSDCLVIDRHIGYWQPYATSHDALDCDRAVQNEVRLAAEDLARAVLAPRAEAQTPAHKAWPPERG